MLQSLPVEAYNEAYLAGVAAVLGVLLSSFVRIREVQYRATTTAPADERQRIRIAAIVFACFSLAGMASLIVLLKDDEVYSQLMYQQIAVSVRAGLGRYSALVYMLPTTLIGTWFLFTYNLRPGPSAMRRVTLVVVPLVISLLHLVQGRRLVWLATVIMALHLLSRRGLLRVRLWWAVPLSCAALLAFVWVGSTKNTGFVGIAGSGAVGLELPEVRPALTSLHDGGGRFDIDAALIAARNDRGFFWGTTFLQAPLYLLPKSLNLARPLGIREDIGRILYGDVQFDLVSQEPSAVSELYCNFGYPGVLIGFFLLGVLCKAIDSRWAESLDPIATIGYGLCLFRLPHHLVTSANSWFGLSVLAFVPLILTAVAIGLLTSTRSERTERSCPPNPKIPAARAAADAS
jgi:hypothetical protein